MDLWTYRRPFAAAGASGEAVIRVGLKSLRSELRLEGRLADSDATPNAGPEAVRNHRLSAPLPDGRLLEVEAGYVNWVTVGIAVRIDGRLAYESHPGRVIAFPKAMRDMTERSSDPGAHFRKNGPALATDLALGIVFFVTAKAFGLTTAALVGAAAGVSLLVVQRFVKVDLLGGLALFGIAILLLSAGYALVFQDEEAVKLRTTAVGGVTALLFFVDGLLGGRWLGRGMARYLPYEGLRLGRLSLGVGFTGAFMAVLNLGVARALPTDVWLFYTTFGDVALAMLLFFAVLRFAQPPRSAEVAAETP